MKEKTNKNSKIKDKQNNQKAEETKTNSKVKVASDGNSKEIIAIILIAVCIFAVVCLIGKAGIVGGVVQTILRGFFGYIGSMILIIATVVLSFSILRGTTRQSFSLKRTLVLVMLTIFLTAFMHTVSGSYEAYVATSSNFIETIVFLWKSCQTHPFAGGLLGGGISTGLILLTTKVGALVILIPGTLVFAMLLFKFSLLPFFESFADLMKKIGHGIASFWTRITAKNNKKEKAVKTNETSRTINIYAGEDNLEDEIDKGVDAVEKPELVISTAEFAKETPKTAEKLIAADSNTTIIFDNVELPDDARTIEVTNPIEVQPVTLPKLNTEETTANDILDEPGLTVEVTPKKNTNTTPILSRGEYADYVYPSLDLLNYDEKAKKAALEASKAECSAMAKKLEETLKNFNVDAQVTNAYIGPSVTRYELMPKMGTKMEAFRRLSDEIAFYLAAVSIRIEAPIPGKSAVGIEVPNKARSTVYLKEVLKSEAFQKSKSKLTASLGYDIQNTPIVTDLAKLPHLLIGGTTGSGKSVCTNGIIMSLLYKATPDEVKLILIDPKMVEFDKYNGIPHLLLPVVTDSKKAASALSWAVSEMDKRYAYFAEHHVSNISAYNDKAKEENLPTMPRIVIIIDELADLMMVAKANVETAINRIAQKARACGMHLVVATQSPRVDVVTGLIKANIGSRIGLSVSNGTDSRIILDSLGAEKLLGRGDMIYAPIGESKMTRIQGAYASDDDIYKVVDFISDPSRGTSYNSEVIDIIEHAGEEEQAEEESEDKGNEKLTKKEDLYAKAIELAMAEGEISTSYIQRRFNIGYNSAANIIDRMVEEGIIERGVGSKKSKVIKRV